MADFSTTESLSSDYPDFEGSRLSERLLLADPNFTATGTPNWLPVAIILPLAAVIALTLAVVCMMTRASRLFRGSKTVLVTDPAMLSNLHHVNSLPYVGVGSEPSYGNGKNNPAFDATSVVDRESLSKL